LGHTCSFFGYFTLSPGARTTLRLSGFLPLSSVPLSLTIYTCVGDLRQHFTPQERFNAALFLKRDLLGVTQVGIGLVLHHGGSSIDGGFKKTAQRIGLGAQLVDLLDDG